VGGADGVGSCLTDGRGGGGGFGVGAGGGGGVVYGERCGALHWFFFSKAMDLLPYGFLRVAFFFCFSPSPNT